MKNNLTIHKLLSSIEDRCFDVSFSSSDGGKFGDSWDTVENTCITRDEILSLIKCKCKYASIFDDINFTESNVNARLEGQARELAWPDGGPSASIEDDVPEELVDLIEELNKTDINDKASVQESCRKLDSVKDGSYTFYITVDSSGEYYFAENEPYPIELTKEQALGIVYSHCDVKMIFDEIKYILFGKDQINDYLEQNKAASDYDCCSYDATCERLDHYIEAWTYIINSLVEGKLNPEELDSWMEYFDDEENFDEDIKDWFDTTMKGSEL